VCWFGGILPKAGFLFVSFEEIFMDDLRVHYGDLSVEPGKTYPGIREVTGDVYSEKNTITRETFPHLERIEGHLRLESVTLDDGAFSVLEEVGLCLILKKVCVPVLAFPALKRIEGGITGRDDEFDYECFPSLQTIPALMEKWSKFLPHSFPALQTAGQMSFERCDINNSFQRLKKVSGRFESKLCLLRGFSISYSLGLFSCLEEVSKEFCLSGPHAVSQGFPVLKRVGGGFFCENVNLLDHTFPQLESVGGHIRILHAEIRPNCFLSLRDCLSLTFQYSCVESGCFNHIKALYGLRVSHSSFDGNVLSQLETVFECVSIDYLSVEGDMRHALPQLKRVGMSLNVMADLEIGGRLETVGAYLTLDRFFVEKRHFPVLKSVGENIYVNTNHIENGVFPALERANKERWDKELRVNVTQNVDPISSEESEKAFFEDCVQEGYLYADMIPSRIVKQRKFGNSVVYKIRIFGDEEESYCVYADGLFSHGKTYKEAKEGLLYKFDKNRDTSAYKDWTLETEVSLRDALESYHVITGACSLGIQKFCQGRKLKKTYTVKEILEETKDAYGHETYAEFFKEGKK
jgi:hypothetical protein